MVIVSADRSPSENRGFTSSVDPWGVPSHGFCECEDILEGRHLEIEGFAKAVSALDKPQPSRQFPVSK